MREERYQGQHDAQPSSSMILHAGYFYERYRMALFLRSSTNDDATTMTTTTTTTTMTTDLVVLYSPLFYWQLLTAASRHWTISVNDVHITVILSYLIAHTTRLLQYVVSHVDSDRVYHLSRGDNRWLLVDYCFLVTIRDCDHAPTSLLNIVFFKITLRWKVVQISFLYKSLFLYPLLVDIQTNWKAIKALVW